jgi:hypothetical protein
MQNDETTEVSMLTRRRFTQLTAALALAPRLRAQSTAPLITAAEIARLDHHRILLAANIALGEQPITLTASHSPRSEGGPHDYFSEGDYWWPDPKNPTGPYIRRDGMSNPDNFNNHREALIRLSLLVPQLTAAWLLTGEAKYAMHAVEHLRAWFVTPATRMNPSLTYAQAIHGVSPGRGTGVIDTLHLVEVARAIRHLESSPAFFAGDQEAVRNWFSDYTAWMIDSKNGHEEEIAKNNHGTCWVAQVASFAALTGNSVAMALCRKRYRENLLPDQLAPDGSLPLELARTKPYSYSLFDLDILAVVCHIASQSPNPDNDLWQFKLPNGNSYQKAVDFYFPFIADKSKWPFAKDVEYFNDLPNRQPSLLFAGIAYNQPQYIALWKKLSPDPKTAEIIRNFPIRQPLLWITNV